MDTEKTLLQQIRDKERDLAEKVEAARAEAEASVAAARSEAASLLCTAEQQGEKAAEQVYWKERGRTQAEIDALSQAAVLEREIASEQGRKNIAAAADRIVRYVTMD